MHLIFKRIFDVFFSSLLITLALPLLIYLWLASGLKERKVWCEDGNKLILKEFNTSVSWMRELPYLFSIMHGNLSFVGCEILDITSRNPELLFKPGLTGLSKLRVAEVHDSTDSTIEHFYLQNQSLIFDLEILFKSILKV